MKIRAAISASARAPFEIADVELDEPTRDEVLVELRAVGICHSDLTMKAVWPEAISPIVLGHEGAGVVAAVGADVTGVRPGDHVVLSYRSCGSCAQCATGHPPYCRDFRTLNGIGSRPDGSPTMRRNGSPVYGSYFGQSSFASHALAYESNVVVVGEEIDLGVAAPMGCGVQTGVGTVLNVLAPPPEAVARRVRRRGRRTVGCDGGLRVRRRHDHRRRSRREPPSARDRARRERDDRPGRR